MTLRPSLNKDIVSKDVRFENAMSWIQIGVDLDSRRIHIDMEVNEMMSAIITRSLLKMTELSNDPIEIYLSTFGGDAYACFAIYDAIRACPCPITVFASGKIMSAGFIIFLAANKRYAAPHTTFMIHSVSSGIEGTIKDQEIDVAEGKRLNNMMLKVLGERTKQNIKWWSRQILSHDKYMDVATATAYGMITEDKPRKSKPVKKVSKKKGKR